MTRQKGLELLRDFLPKAGKHYAERRNYDEGMQSNHPSVSKLSPYICRRLIGEWEIIEEVLKTHPIEVAEKYIQEIIWRTYWKGWLEQRPIVWSEYRAQLAATLDTKNSSKVYERVTEGKTDLACINDWVTELKTTNYLHNHSRLWFASLWIYHFGLPWEWGSEFFFRHLADADAASNTLSWRWVAGLQTKGKKYFATPENISKFTRGRYLVENLAFELSYEAPTESVNPFFVEIESSEFRFKETDRDWILLRHHEDCLVDFKSVRPPRYLVNIDPQKVFENLKSQAAIEWDVKSLTNSDPRLLEVTELSLEEALNKKLPIYGITPNVGPLQDYLRPLIPSDNEINWIRRAWDQTLWPYAKKGFFPFKEKVFERLRTGELLKMDYSL